VVLRHFTTLFTNLGLSLRQVRAAIFVLALGLVVSFAAWRVAGQWVYGESSRKFEQDVAQAVEMLEQRLQDTTDLLRGVRGLFAASNHVERDEFHRYLGGANIVERYPGVRLIGYSQRVTRAERQAFEEGVRSDRSLDPRGYPDFAIHPPGDRAEYLVVTYLEPMHGNERAFGYDFLSDPERRVELERVRDRGQVTATGPFRLAADGYHTVAVLLRVPIYRRDLPTATLEQRRAAFTGLVTSAMNVDELMTKLLGTRLGNEFDLVVRDLGPAPGSADSAKKGASTVLFDSLKLRDPAAPRAGGRSDFTKAVSIDLSGRTWELAFSSPPAALGIASVLPPVVLLGGVITTLLLCWLVGTLTLSRARALRLAEQATAMRATEDLREQLDFIQQLIETVPQPIFFKAADGRYLGVNKAWETFFGIPRNQFIGKTVFELYPNDQELARRHHARDQELFNRPGSQSYEAAIVAADGRVHHTIYNKATFNRADGAVAGLIGTITDVSELKIAEAALREGEARFRDLTELSSDWYWEQDAEFRFTHVSSKIREFIADADALIGRTRWELGLSGVSEEQWLTHRSTLAEHRPFVDFQYERPDAAGGGMRVMSITGRPIFDEEGRFKGYRGTGRDITDAKRVEERIRHMAHHDALTDLPNRVLLYDRVGQLLARARRGGQMLAVLFIDLDRFKNVNDSLGHQVGDRLLQLVAERLRACVRESDTVARLGGDEFVVVVPDLAQPADAAGVAQKLLESLAQPFRIDSHDLHITPSVGICAYPDDGEDVETLMRNADTAMYHAKEMGRNNYQFFTAGMNAAAQHRLALENDLRRALERAELTLHYQPQLDLKTGDIIGFEALARWRHPERGMVPPAQFIPVAEDSGLINRLGEWVLEQACAQAEQWRRAGMPRLQVAVNLSAQQFRREGVAQTVASVLRQTGLPAHCLELEITESVIIQQAGEAVVKLTELNEMDVQLSLDDFGTGYSSLSYLKRFPIDKLKIDQSFVRDISTDPDDAAIVTAIIAMAHSLGLEVIAEGVETAEQLAFLKLLGCDKAQGYYFSKPLPAEEFESLLRDWTPRARVATA
jgi:diguanylate cyclase (GGDEF)-like protein/PAS domain S-box-containing protein